MKLFRYRRPSLKTILGLTAAKKRIKRNLGITAALKPSRWLGNQKRTVKRQVGYYSAPMRLIRNGLPTPGGCLVVIVAGVSVIGLGIVWILV